MSSARVRLAWVIAIVADTTQLALLPLFSEGALSPADTVLDLLVGFSLVRLLGWHWAFLPTFAAELIPGLDLFPSWTAAVWFVSRQRMEEMGKSDPKQAPDVWSNPPEPEILPPDPAIRRG
ncbi:MAG TPA: hypothetical protein VF753_08380 [Terriglobales bacterium]